MFFLILDANRHPQKNQPILLFHIDLPPQGMNLTPVIIISANNKIRATAYLLQKYDPINHQDNHKY